MTLPFQHFSKSRVSTPGSGLLACVVAVGFVMGAFVLAARGNPMDGFRIGGEVLQKDAPNFSTNLRFGTFAPWNTDLFVNAWNLPFAAGPVYFQNHGQADNGGANWLEHKTGGGLSEWDSARSGFWDGADVRIYRIVDGVMTQIRTAVVSSSSMGKDPATGLYLEDQKLWFEEAGEPVRAGDYYVLRMKRTEHPPQYRPALSAPSASPLLNGYCQINGNGTWSFDESTKAPEGGSQASLKILAQQASPSVPCGPWHWYVIHGDSDNGKARFRAGKQYKAQVWLKQEGMSDPRVTLQFGTIMTRTVTVDEVWRKYEFDLPVHSPESPYQTAAQGATTRMLIGAVSPGTFWIDNFVVYQADEPPFAVLREEVEILKKFRPHTLRLWGGLDAMSLEYWLNEGFAMPTAMKRFGRTDNPVMVSLGQSLKVCEEVGADPWLILNPWFSAEEHAKLMEYLAAPADVGYGQLRASHGRVEPWTTAFRKIHLESANEAWNSIMRYSVSQPEIYAAIADRQFRDLKESPYYNAAKFEFIANGWDNSMSSTGWTRRVAAASRESDRIDVAYYFGGWEKGVLAGDDPEAEANEVFQDKLFGASLEFGRVILDSLLMDSGFATRLAKSMQADPALLAGGLGAIPTGSPVFSPENLQASPGDLAGLWAKDTGFASSIRSVVAVQRSYCDNPFLHAAYRAVAKDPGLQASAITALDLAEPAILEALAEGVADSNPPSRLLTLFKQHPVSVQRWSQVFTGTALSDLNSFIEKQDKLTYNITNELNRRLRETVIGMANSSNSTFLEALQREATQELILSKLPNYLNYVVSSSFNGSPGRRVEHLLQAMKASPTYATSVFAAIAQSPSAFQNEAVSMASVYSSEIISLHAQGEPFQPNDDSRLLLRALPAPVRLEMWQRLNEAVQNAGPNLNDTSRRLLEVLIAAQLGDTAPALSLASNTAFVNSLQQQLMDRTAEPFLAAAKVDAMLGNRLLATVATIPSPTAKRLAVYEGGPGYSLPGAGIPVPQADENIGKSLALGTATLDASLQFLTAAGAPVAYYDYKTGDYWASHNNPVDRVPYPTWLALQMRNTLCPGDLLRVDAVAVKSVNIADKQIYKTNNDGTGSLHTVRGRNNVPLLSLHAFRSAQDVSLLVLNRSLDESRTATIEMPADFHGVGKLHVLTHSDPKANNRVQENVSVVEQDGTDFRDGMVVTVPPASVVVVTGGRAGAPLPLVISNNATLEPLLLGDSSSSISFVGEGGIRPYAWSLHSGALPEGMELDGTLGRLIGTPVATGTYGFQIQMEDTRGRKIRKSFSVRVNPDTPRITAVELPAAVTGEDYTWQLEATLGKPPYTWTTTSTLPPGMSLGEGGLLSGTPSISAAGNYSITVRATGMNGQFRSARFPLVVQLSEAPAIETSLTLPPGEVGQAYPAGVSFQASGGKAPYSWRLLSGPGGLVISAEGILSGFPTVASPDGEPSTVRVRVTGADGRSTIGDFGVVIQPAMAPLVSTPDLLPNARIGVPYSHRLTASGGLAPFSFEAVSGLPEGFVLSSSGVLSGVALETASHSILVRLADAGGASSHRVLTLRAAPSATPVIIGPARLAARQGALLDAGLIAVGGVMPYQWTVASGALPVGVSLNATTGLLEGVPVATGSSVFASRVTDANGRSHTLSHTMVVSPDAPVIERSALPGASSGEFYSHQFQASLGHQPYSWSVGSGLPAGLEMSSDGLLSGTPPHSMAGNHSLLVRVTGANGVASAVRFPLVIALSESPRILTANTLPEGELGQAYVGAAFQAEGGNLPHRWVLVSGPKGLSMTSEGLLSGYPAESGENGEPLPVRVRVFSATGRAATGDFTIRVNPTDAPVISNADLLPGARIGLVYRVAFTAQGGIPPYRFSGHSPLPGGLVLTENGVLTGKTQEVETWKFLVRVEDAAGAASVKEFTLKSVHSSVPVITGPSRVVARAGLGLEVPLEAVGGKLPYQWTVASGSLPVGVSLDSSTGVLAGTTNETGLWDFSSMVTDGNGRTHTYAHRLDVVLNRPVISREELATAVAGSFYRHDFTATLGTAPYLWTATSTLPRGLSLSTDGELSGIPATNAIGNHTLSIRATGADGLAATLRFPFLVVEAGGIAPMSLSMVPYSIPATVSEPVLESTETPGRFLLKFTASTNLPMKVQVCSDPTEGFQDVPDSQAWASEGRNEVEVEVPPDADRAFWRVVVDEAQ
jgi:alpha-L-arabinofuranosidase